MVVVSVDATGLTPEALEEGIRRGFERHPDDAVVSLKINGSITPGAEEVLRAANLRRLHPAKMTVTVRFKPRRR
jgi:hypothetical protein